MVVKIQHLLFNLFANIFPETCKRKSYLVTINHGNASVEKTQNNLFRVQQIFYENEQVLLHGNPENSLGEFLNKHSENSMVVMSSFGRSILSRIFKPDLANILLHQTGVSIFITHN